VIADSETAALDAAARSELERTGQPGLTLGVTDRDGTLVVRSYGVADLATEAPIAPDTLFEIGSIGKTFTAILVLQLVDEGVLELEAPVDRYLPWFAVPRPAGSAPIAIAHLLSHTSGIAAGIDGTPEAAFQVRSLRDLPTRSRPGERFHYSNVGYKALGLVLEAVTGRRYPELLRARILDPLGMSDTEPAITHEMRSRLAVGYEYLHDDRLGHPGAPLAPATWLETDTADGSIASNAADMCAFARVLLRGGEPVLSERGFAAMTTAHGRLDETVAYGFGLTMREIGGRRLIGHGGGMVGYLAGVQADPEAGVGAVVLQNGVSSNPMELARAAVRIVRDGPDAAQPPPAAADAFSDLTGVYRRGSDSVELLTGQDGLTLRWDGREVELEEWDDDLFLAPHADFDRFAFSVDRSPDGPPELWHGDRRFVRDGAEPRTVPEPTAELLTTAGHYRSHNPWTTNFRVVLRGDRPWLTFASAPDGFDDEQPLVALPDGSFRVGEDPGNPETVRFDAVQDDRALRAWLSGWPYYRAG
jgi:CubicO group peptidase (beta-lactamase class C family)